MEAVRTRPGKLPPGSQLGDTYQIVRLIGEGGMGEVYEVRHARLAGRYAVKVIRPDLVMMSETTFKRFQREAEVTSSLRHPNIVQIIDFNQTPDGSPYIVMEYLEGIDLETRLRQRGTMSIAEALPILEQIASALTAAHAHGIIHRDLKPQNVLLVSLPQSLPGQATEFVKVVDFGISKATSAATLTSVPIAMGTPHYMAPEQARGVGEDLDGRADQFALGAITYELLSGRRAFPGDTVPAIIYNVVHEPPDSLAAIVGVPINEVLLTAMAKDPDARYPSMTAYVAALRAAAGLGGVTGTQIFGQKHGEPLRSPQPITPAGGATPARGARPAGATKPRRSSEAETLVDSAPNDSAPNVAPTEVTRRPTKAWPRVMGALLAVGALAAGGWFYTQRSRTDRAPVVAEAPAAAQATRAAVKQALEGERQTLAATVSAAAQVTELHNAASSQVDKLTFKDLFDTEDWWQPYRALAVAVFEGERLMSSSRVASETAATWSFWRPGATVVSDIVASGAGKPPYVAAGTAFSAKPGQGSASHGLVLARPLDQRTLVDLAQRTGASLLAISDGREVLVVSDPAASDAAAVVAGKEGRPVVALPDGRAAVPLPIGKQLWIWSVAPAAEAR